MNLKFQDLFEKTLECVSIWQKHSHQFISMATCVEDDGWHYINYALRSRSASENLTTNEWRTHLLERAVEWGWMDREN